LKSLKNPPWQRWWQQFADFAVLWHMRIMADALGTFMDPESQLALLRRRMPASNLKGARPLALPALSK
jgi:hypothetical protein